MSNRQPKNNRVSLLTRLRVIGLGKERSHALESLALLVTSGMTMSEALESIAADAHSRRMRRVIKRMQQQVAAGVSLWKVFAGSGLFPQYVVSLLRIGEETGQLPENIKLVADQEKKNRIFRTKLFSAMMYPTFVLVLTLVVSIAIAWFILPNLANVFSSLDMELPYITQLLIAAGQFLQAHGAVAVPAFVAGVGLLLVVLFAIPWTRNIGRWLLFKLPGTGRLVQEVELSRLGYLLGALLSAGIVVTDAFASLADATTSPSYRKFYRHMQVRLDAGDSFKSSMDSYRKIDQVIPPPIQGMIMAGERSGNLPDTLHMIGTQFEDRLETTTKNLTVILEPLLLVIVWLGVVGVALAVILPIYNLIGGLNT